MPLYTNVVIPVGKKVGCKDAGVRATQERLPNLGPWKVSSHGPEPIPSQGMTTAITAKIHSRVVGVAPTDEFRFAG